MKVEATSPRDEEAHLVLAMPMLREKLLSGRLGVVRPKRIGVVGPQTGHVDVLVAAIGVDIGDQVAIESQNVRYRRGGVERGCRVPATEIDPTPG